MNTDYMELCDRIAVRAHLGQVRRDGTPYIAHPRRVASRLFDSVEKGVALLHDVLEDSDITEEDLERAGLHEETIRFVDHLSKKLGQTYREYLELVKLCPVTRQVKIADMLDNLSDAPTPKQVKKYAEGLAFLLDLEPTET